MKHPRKKQNRKKAALMITVLVYLAVAALHLAGAFHFLEYKSYDLRVRLLAPYSRPSDEIIVIVLDQDSIDWAQREKGWAWPWPRTAYAEVVNYMNISGAHSVAFDIIFSEPSMYQDGDDAAFIQAEKKFGRTVQTVFFSRQTGNTRTWPEILDKPLFQPDNFGPLLHRFRITQAQNTTGAQFPIQGLRDAAGALGSISARRDSDGIIRSLQLFTLFDGKAVPGLSAASVLASGGLPQIQYDQKNKTINWGTFSIPVDRYGRSLLRFRGDLSRYIPYRAKEILQSAEAFERGGEPRLPPENFKNTYVFFGLYAPGLFDIFSTPISPVYPGMGCHVTMLDNMLQGDFIREINWLVNLLILFAAVSLTVLLGLFSTRIPLSTGGTIFSVLIIIAASFAAYQWGNLWLPMVTHLAGIAAAFISVTLYNYATEGIQKRFIKSAFGQYLSPKVVDQIIADPSQLNLGGEKREMTAIFTDVRSFSTISEAQGSPEKLVELLNHYLTRMSDIILENQGTIDKYEGDAIIAFFGAPARLENHASLACRSAIQMKKAEPGINREALDKGLITGGVIEVMVKKGILKNDMDPCPLFTRLGINTGDMVVGNMGTPRKMNYTIMGNAVNLAARLEGVNKQYNTGGILISEYTRARIGGEFIARPLSRVRVVGINTPLRLYELLDTAEAADPELLTMVKHWEAGFAAYESRNFQAAQTVFMDIFRQNSADLTAKKYADRCGAFTASPPDEAAWNSGVDNLTEK
jgi:adenylate cyclase